MPTLAFSLSKRGEYGAMRKEHVGTAVESVASKKSRGSPAVFGRRSRQTSAHAVPAVLEAPACPRRRRGRRLPLPAKCCCCWVSATGSVCAEAGPVAAGDIGRGFDRGEVREFGMSR